MVTPLTFPIKVLAGPLSSTGDRLVLPDIKGWDGNDLTAAELGNVHYVVLQDFGRTKMEIMEADPSTLTVATTTGVLLTKRGLSFTGGLVDGAETKHDWTPNETYVMFGSNPPQIYTDLMDLNEAQTVTGVKTFSQSSMPRVDTDHTYVAGEEKLFATYKAVQDASYGGTVNATETAKGIGEIPTTVEIDADAELGSTGASLLVNPKNLATSKYGTRLPSADQKAALVGQSGTSPTVYNKYEDYNDTTVDGIQASQTTENATIAVGEADATGKNRKIYQSFIATKSSLTAITLSKAASTGTNAGDVAIYINPDNAGVPGSPYVTNGYKNITAAIWNGYSTGANLITFASPVTLVPGTRYWITVIPSTADNSNHINLGTNSAGGYADGKVMRNNVTDGTTDVATIDLYFKCHNTQASKLVRTKSNGKLDESVCQMTDAQTVVLADTVSGSGIIASVASDTVVISGNAEKSVSSTSSASVNAKSFVPRLPGTYRLKFDVKTLGANGGSVTITQNGVTIATEVIASGDTTYRTATKNLELLPGQTVLLVLNVAGTGSSNTAYVKNFQVCYNIGYVAKATIAGTVTEL